MTSKQTARKPSQRGYMRQRSPGSWELKAYAGLDRGGQASYRYRTVRGSESFARRQLRSFVEDCDREADAIRASGGRKVGDLIDTYMERCESDWSPSTVTRQRHIVSKYLWPLRSVPLHELTAELISEHYQKLRTGVFTSDELPPATVRRAHNVLRAMLEHAVNWEWIDRNPAIRATVPNGRSKEPVLPKADQLESVLHIVENGDERHRPDPLFALAIHLTAATGMRQGEVCGLEWRDVDFVRHALEIRRSVVDGADRNGNGVIVREEPKTHNSKRRIAMPEDAMERLVEAHEQAEKNASTVGLELSPLAFLLSDELDGLRPWSPHRLGLRWRRSRGRFGIPDVTWHAIRHYVATHLLASGVSTVNVAARLGDSPKTIELIYAHAVPAQDQVSAELLSLSSRLD